MNPICRFWTAALLAAGTAVSTTTLLAAEPSVEITPREGWSAMFGGEEVKRGYVVAGQAPLEGRIVWSYSAQRRTIARGELSANVGPHGPITIEIPLRLPEVREGIAYDTELRLQLVDDRQNVAAEHNRVIRLFPRDAFADRREWLDRLKIVLYDPTEKTEKTFDEADVPYAYMRSLTALKATSEGMVVIGEGVSWTDYPALPEALVELAAGGRSVLCLAPADGYLVFPGVEQGQPKPGRVSLRRNDVIGELDKRLDADAWPPRGEMVAAAVQPTSRSGRVVLAVTDSPEAWPWLEVAYPGGGRLIVCGFGLIDHWQAGPTPRYLLVRVFERLSQGAETPRNSLEQE